MPEPHLDGCCRTDRHIVPFDCETPDFDREPIVLPADQPVPPYERQVLVDVLVYHYRDGFKGCGCGWSELGRSWPEHVATVYEESVAVRTENLAASAPDRAADVASTTGESS